MTLLHTEISRLIKKEPVELGNAPRIGIGHREVTMYLSKMVVKSDFKKRSYGLDTILLQGHAVTLTFMVATPNLSMTRRLNMVIIYVK